MKNILKTVGNAALFVAAASSIACSGAIEDAPEGTSALALTGGTLPGGNVTGGTSTSLGSAAPAPHVMPVKGAQAVAPAAPGVLSQIDYHGGAVMHTPVIYYIWYGNWANDTAPAILTDLAQNIGGSSYLLIDSSYSDPSGPVSPNITFGGATSVGYSRGTSLDLSAVQGVVTDVVGHSLPTDPNGVYFVLSSADVAQHNGTTSFGVDYCGWHTFATIAGSDIKFAWVGNAAHTPRCLAYDFGPNNNAAADAMASVIAHELDEAVTDPHVDAWFTLNAKGEQVENADACAWNFGAEYVANGGYANVHLGARDYLIQQNWLNGSGCLIGARRLTIKAGNNTISGSYRVQPNQVASFAVDPARTFSLTATPTAGATFSKWTGCSSTSGTSCTVRASSDRTVSATSTLNCSSSCYDACFNTCTLPKSSCVTECRVECCDP